MSSNFDRSPVPLVLAVVGHRDPIARELPRLRQAFRRDLLALMEQLPATPLLLLNGLASGMDSEAAEVFLAVVAEQRQRDPHGPVHQLVAALPKNVENYRHDFSAGVETERLEHLLSCCSAVLDPTNCADLRGPLAPGEELPSPDCYGQQGVFLVRHGYLMAAFHNGVESLEVGGTSQSVAMQKGQVHPLFLNVDEVIAAREPGALIEYDTPRHKSIFSGPQPRPQRCLWLETRQTHELSDLLEIPRRIDVINRHLQSPALQFDSQAPLPTALWAAANQQAIASKSRYLLWVKLLLFGGWLISLALAQPPWQSLGLVLILVALVLFPRAQRGPKHAFIVSRCLAEAITVQDFWAELGVEVDAADLFHSQVHQDLGWIRTMLRARRVQLLAQQAVAMPPLARTCHAVEAWMADQVAWLDRTIRTQSSADRRLQGLALACFVAALLFSLLAVTPAAGPVIGWITEASMASFVVVLAYRELLGYEETNARYQRSRDQFRRGLAAFRQALASPDKDPQRLQRLRCALDAVGREKLDELNDWVADQLKRAYRPGS